MNAMTLRNRILITIGTLIIITALTIIYIAKRAMYHSNISHAYSVLVLSNETLRSDIKTKISNLKSYAISSTYNRIKSYNTPSTTLKNEDKIGLTKFRFAKSIVVSSNDNSSFISYPEGIQNGCTMDIKYYPSNNILFAKSNSIINSICIYMPITVNNKKYLAAFDVFLNFFSKGSVSFPTLIVSPNRFELNLENFMFLDFKNAKFRSLLENPEIIKEKSSFLKSNNNFILLEEVPNTNLRILSYNSVETVQTAYKFFITSSIGSMFLILIIAIVIFFFAINSFLKPIKNLCTASKCFADGIYNQKIDPTSFKEINELISSFNIMIKKIQERESELQKLNTNLGREVEKKTSELLHAAKMASLGTLSSGIAHEFNNILGAVIGHVSLALEKQNSEEMREALEIALMASERACSIVSRLQDFSKKKNADYKIFNINDAINNITKLIGRDFVNSRINIKLDLSKVGAVKIEGNQSEIEQVLLNLLINSKHAIPNGGNVTIKTSVQDGKLIIRITDTGYGIDDSIKNRIFEPFFTTKGVVGMGKSFGSQDEEGVGLGLSVSLGIIENHRGTIRLVSTSENGTTFEILIPLPEE